MLSSDEIWYILVYCKKHAGGILIMEIFETENNLDYPLFLSLKFRIKEDKILRAIGDVFKKYLRKHLS